jgi:hypothetical protein
MPFSYEDLSFEDRIASMILVTMYSSDHVEVALTVPPVPQGLKPKAQSAFVSTRLDGLQHDVAAARVHYESAYPENGFCYRLLSRNADVSEIGFDTVAVTLLDREILAACNYKVRTTPGAPASVENRPAYASFGAVRGATRLAIIKMLQSELSGLGLTLRFIGPTVAPTNDVENARPHAEMQLISYLARRADVRGMSFGVSKACCQLCAEQLTLREVSFTARDGLAMRPANWVAPLTIHTTVEFEATV